MAGPVAIATVAKLAAKYGPHVAEAVRVGGPAAREAVATQQKRIQSRRFAFDKARTVANGSVLRQRDNKDVVWVVFSGDEAVAVYPQVQTPIDELVKDANLSGRVTPDQHDAAKARGRAASAARRAVARAKPRRNPVSEEPRVHTGARTEADED